MLSIFAILFDAVILQISPWRTNKGLSYLICYIQHHLGRVVLKDNLPVVLVLLPHT